MNTNCSELHGLGSPGCDGACAPVIDIPACEVCGASELRGVEVHPNARAGHEKDFLCPTCEAELTAEECAS